MKFFLAATFFFALTTATAQRVSIDDFGPVLGKLKGTITYKDYTTGKPFTMPVEMELSKSTASGTDLVASIRYPQEPKANGNDTLRISAGGTQIDGAMVTDKKILADGSLEIITERKGVDGNEHKPATIRHYYVIAPGKYTSRKEVRFEGESQWIVRNIYALSKM